jgi:hypothetical protein
VSKESYLYLGLFFGLIVFISHLAIFDLPYSWDEISQFIPAAWNFHENGGLLPASATASAPAPGLTVYLTTIWKLFWPAVETTRFAMLLLGSLSLLAAFLLGVELCAWIPGVPAMIGILLLAISPVFFMQAFLAQQDMPAMLLTCLGLYWFLRERIVWSAAACTALVLFKETGVALPAVLALWLLSERRWKSSACYALPLLALAAWYSFQGRWNLQFVFLPGLVARAVARRALFLTLDNGHFFAVAAILAAWRAGHFAHRRWRVAWLFFFCHLAFVCTLAGAPRERYLLPVLPIYYMAAGAGILSLQGAARTIVGAGQAVCLLISLFWVPPWPADYENSYALIDFVRIQQEAAVYLEDRYRDKVITTAWPLGTALRRPEFGYVRDGLRTDQEPTFSRSSFAKRPPGSVELFVLYSRDWDPPDTFLASRLSRRVARHWLATPDALTGEEIPDRFGLQLVRRMSKGGQWVEIYARPGE